MRYYLMAWVALAGVACARGTAVSADAACTPPLARFLPDSAGAFSAGPITVGEAWVRREYVRGATRMSVTLASQGGGNSGYVGWVQASAGYAQVALEAAPGDANGFYDCGGQPESCSAHIQTRTGVHIEVMGNGTASRADLDGLLAALPIRALAR